MAHRVHPGLMHLRRTSPRFPVPWALALIAAWPAFGQEDDRPADTPSDLPLPAHVRPLAQLPPEILELRDGLENCFPLSELQDRDHALFIEGSGGFSQLFAVPCAGSGYNLSSVIYLESAGEITLQSLRTYSRDKGWGAAPEIFNVEWDDQRGVLRGFLKGRSLGNCGSIGEWRYGDGELRLERYFHQPDCSRVAVPEEFPLIFEHGRDR